jgi:hypothetical protein
MAAGSGRLDFGIVGLSLLSGSALSMGFIQLLAGPLEEMSTLSVQSLAVQISALASPLLISLLMVLRQGPRLVALGARLARRPASLLLRLWLQQAPAVSITAMGLVPYQLAAALMAAMLTKPQVNSLAELKVLAGNLTPSLLVLALLKTALFSALILGITLDQGARARRQNLPNIAALSRAISVSIAVVLGLDLAWALALDPSLSGVVD